MRTVEYERLHFLCILQKPELNVTLLILVVSTISTKCDSRHQRQRRASRGYCMDL
jgi:hypothetical protein